MARPPRLLAVGVALAAVAGAVHLDVTSVGASSVGSVIGQGEPALSFASDGRFFLQPQVFVYSSGDSSGRSDLDHNIGGGRYFDRLEVREREQSAGSLRFTIEDLPDKSMYQWCDGEPVKCAYVEVGVVEDSGALFLFADEASITTDIIREGPGLDGGPRRLHYVNDFPTQRVELSVEVPDQDLKVYREVSLRPSERAPDCADYPGQNADRYTCLFLEEVLPSDPPDASADMISALPNLVQPKANYRLVFAEEFNGTPEEDGCKPGLDNGMVTLSGDVWHFDTNPCDNVDRNGVPCENVEDGSFYMAVTTRCSSVLNSNGKVSFKYGYIEVKYTADMRDHGTAAWLNMALSIGDPLVHLKHKYRSYNISGDDYEAVTRHLGTVINLFEFLPSQRREVSHQWINPYGDQRFTTTEPRRSSKLLELCRRGSPPSNPDPFFSGGACKSTETITRGIEWTPRGYRSFYRVDGGHDSLAVVAMDKISIEHWPSTVSTDGQVSFSSTRQTLGGSQRGGFFEFQTDGDSDSILEQLGISHIPLEFETVAHGNPNRDRIQTKLKIDYIRVFQPVDRYTGMEPVYQ